MCVDDGNLDLSFCIRIYDVLHDGTNFRSENLQEVLFGFWGGFPPKPKISVRLGSQLRKKSGKSKKITFCLPSRYTEDRFFRNIDENKTKDLLSVFHQMNTCNITNVFTLEPKDFGRHRTSKASLPVYDKLDEAFLNSRDVEEVVQNLAPCFWQIRNVESKSHMLPGFRSCLDRFGKNPESRKGTIWYSSRIGKEAEDRARNQLDSCDPEYTLLCSNDKWKGLTKIAREFGVPLLYIKDSQQLLYLWYRLECLAKAAQNV